MTDPRAQAVDPVANEQALRYLAAELQRAHLSAAQMVGNLALAQSRLDAAQVRVAELEAAAAAVTPIVE